MNSQRSDKEISDVNSDTKLNKMTMNGKKKIPSYTENYFLTF